MKTPAPFDLAALLAAAMKDHAPQTFRYRFSSAGEPCLRALVYDARDADAGKPPAFSARRLRDMLAMACGRGVDEQFGEAAKSLGYRVQASHEFKTCGITIRGNSDILAQGIGLDVKLVGEKSWERRPHKRHELQVNGYAVEKDLPLWGLLYIRGSTIFDEDSPEVEWDLFTGQSSVEMAQELCGVWVEVEQHRKLKTLPERVFGASPTAFPCGWCKHLERCAPEAEQ